MHPITRATLCTLAAAVTAAPAAAASDYFLKFDGPIKGESPAKASGGKQLEILSWSWGTTMTGAWDGTIKGASSTEKLGAVSGTHRDESLGSPTGKRQHDWTPVSKPLDRGSVRVKVKLPWLDCRVGAAFADAVLQNDAGRFEFQDVFISGCAADGVALNYASYRESPTRASQK